MAKGKRPQRRKGSRSRPKPVINANAAGIDVGSREIYVAVPVDRDPEAVRTFHTFTPDLIELAEWLATCGVSTVAMEATSVYWMPLFTILEERGIEVCLVNARHLRRVPGRKTDILDCEWLQYLHSVGLLRGSFHPPEAVAAVRTLLRHKASLVQMAASHVQHMHKALTQMNLQLHHVISDITGLTGLRILDAILDGERRPEVLADLRHPSIKADKATIAKALSGTWRREHLFTLRQSLTAYRHYQTQIEQCHQELHQLLGTFGSRVDPEQNPLPPIRGRRKDPLGLDLRTEFYRIFGVDLTAIPGVEVGTVYTLFAECGRDLSAFPTAGDFASWLGLCPDNRITGGKILSTRTRKVIHPLATALRLAAQALHHSQSALGDYFRRMRYRIGPAQAITAAAHKLARIIYRLVTARMAYDETVLARNDHKTLARKTQRLKAQAAALGYHLVPAEAS